eukprot:CAMPEP_0174726390 /NCGR_PEP_ID=MMETSP1094-20130205/47729_1 /TAXON_ID=156173 /ORGANISM="Chrysochromulina brevifilum, Strain UTEX LB 985" /LENGTH=49 /DNA_ID= /DNA_START= /DNA_END= /DNA_ORIENTATION=
MPCASVIAVWASRCGTRRERSKPDDNSEEVASARTEAAAVAADAAVEAA